MIRFSCPHCQAQLQADVPHIGRNISCGNCKQSVIVPHPPVAVRVDAPAAAVSRPATAHKAHRRNLIIGVTSVLLFSCFVPSGLGWLLYSFWREKTPTTQELKMHLLNRTPEEVQHELGEPAEKKDGPLEIQGGIYGGPGRGSGALEFQEELQNAVWKRKRYWVYRRKTRDEKTGDVRPTFNVWFQFGRVVHVSTP